MDIKYSFILTFISGFFTMIGSLIIFIKSKNINNIINISLSFATGVMVSISVLDLIPESYRMLIKTFNNIPCILIICIFLFLGSFVSILIDKFSIDSSNSLYKVGIISFLSIIIHNLPEGIATFMTSNMNKRLGLSMATAIAMHNLPEGIAVAVPIYYGTKSKLKSLLYSFVASISEPFGALIAYLFLSKYINNTFMGYLFSFIAGLMIYISIFELLKEAIKYRRYVLTFIFILIGSVFMIINLYAF